MSKVKGNSPDSSELPWVWRRVGTVTVRLIVVSLSLERCPRIQSNCEFKERDECSKNKKCPKHEKCCFFSCGRKCINLQQGKQILRASITNPLPISFPSAPLGWPCPLFTKGWSLSKIAGLGKLEIQIYHCPYLTLGSIFILLGLRFCKQNLGIRLGLNQKVSWLLSTLIIFLLFFFNPYDFLSPQGPQLVHHISTLLLQIIIKMFVFLKNTKKIAFGSRFTACLYKSTLALRNLC